MDVRVASAGLAVVIATTATSPAVTPEADALLRSPDWQRRSYCRAERRIARLVGEQRRANFSALPLHRLLADQ